MGEESSFEETSFSVFSLWITHGHFAKKGLIIKIKFVLGFTWPIGWKLSVSMWSEWWEWGEFELELISESNEHVEEIEIERRASMPGTLRSPDRNSIPIRPKLALFNFSLII